MWHTLVCWNPFSIANDKLKLRTGFRYTYLSGQSVVESTHVSHALVSWGKILGFNI